MAKGHGSFGLGRIWTSSEEWHGCPGGKGAKPTGLAGAQGRDMDAMGALYPTDLTNCLDL